MNDSLIIYFNSFLKGKLHICEIPDLIDRDLLMILRNECGGLQTLLRNYCQIFEGIHVINIVPLIKCTY